VKVNDTPRGFDAAPHTLNRRQFNGWLAAALATAAHPYVYAQAPQASAKARKVYGRATVIDGCGGPGGFDPTLAPGAALSAAMVADAKASGITAVNLTVGAIGNGPSVYEDTVAGIALAEREIALHPGVFMKVLRADDLRTAKANGKLGLVYGFQDGSMLGSTVDRLDHFYHLGVRIVQPTYNQRNLLGDGCLETADAGLSTFGRQVIERIGELGILIDLSHCGQRTSREAIAAAKAPLAFTHSGCRALVDVPRNRTDEELRAVANKGGVTGIYFMPFLRESGQPMAADVVRHIDHAVNVCGEDHVGVGSDGGISTIELNDAYRKMHREFVETRTKNGYAAPGEAVDVFNFALDLNTPRRLETLADLLLQRGYGEARVEKILGGNFARLFREVWK
jgi:membrane dipeptidase